MATDWYGRALCTRHDPELFFTPDRERGRARADRERLAKLVCAACPVREPCLAHALAAGRVQGVWGGLSEHEREQRQRAADLVASTTPR